MVISTPVFYKLKISLKWRPITDLVNAAEREYIGYAWQWFSNLSMQQSAGDDLLKHTVLDFTTWLFQGFWRITGYIDPVGSGTTFWEPLMYEVWVIFSADGKIMRKLATYVVSCHFLRMESTMLSMDVLGFGVYLFIHGCSPS